MRKTSDQKVIAALGNALAANIPEWYGQGAKLQREHADLRAYPYSFFVSFPVQTSSGEKTLFAKIHRKPYMATLSEALAAEWLQPIAREEYEMTRVISCAFDEENSPMCTAIQPLGLMDEWNAILMRKVDGKPLKKYLLRASVVLRFPSARAELQQHLKSSIIWLRVFHERVAGTHIAPFPANDAMALMNEILARLSSQSKGQIDVEAYRSGLLKQLESIGILSVPVGLLHDDFQYSNILIEPDGRACVLDYALNYRGCVYSDLATLMVDPQTREIQILSGGRIIAPGFISAFNHTILNAYFNGEPFHKSVLDFYCALAVLNKWSADEAEIANGWRKKLSPIFSRVTRRYYAKLLAQYCKSI